MKKIILATLLAATLPAAAQTDFRHITFNQAKEAAKTEGKLIFVDFYTQWCGPCKRMATTVFPKKEIGDYLNAGFVNLKLDAEAEGADLAKTVGIKAYPTLMVFDADGNPLGSFAGMKDGQEFITAVEMCKNPDLTPERIKQRYAAGERTPELVRAYAINIIDSSHDYMAAMTQAGKIIDEYFDTLTDSQRLSPDHQFLYDTYTTGYNSPRIQFMIDNRDRFDTTCTDAIAENIKIQHQREASRYFTTNSVTDDTTRRQFEDFKQRSRQLGYASDYETQLRFAEARATMDTDAYIKYCDKNYSRLTDDERGQLLAQLTAIFAPATPEQTRKVTAFARKHLATLPASSLVWAAYATNELESPRH